MMEIALFADAYPQSTRKINKKIPKSKIVGPFDLSYSHFHRH